MARARWGSRMGFVLAAAGSAIGLANIWRFPYIVGFYGGAAFIAIYLLFLLLIGLPVFAAEVLIGRKTHLNPIGAFRQLGGNKAWTLAGAMTLFTGLVVSAFYSVVAGWVVGYLQQALSGQLATLHTPAQAAHHFSSVIASPVWVLLSHTCFMGLSAAILYSGVQKGLEKGNKFMLPLLFLMLLFVLSQALMLPNAWEGVLFLLQPDWKVLTPAAFLTALGHAFFTLSLGQGTMVTYGSYLNGDENMVTTLFSAVVMDTLVSILAALAVFAIVFSAGVEPSSGPGLLFTTLPPIFASMAGGQAMAVAFFSLMLLAALTSQISAMEPSIALLRDRFNWGRHRSVIAVAATGWVLGVPLALSTGYMPSLQIDDHSLLDIVSNFASDCLIPLGGLAAVLLVGWRWGIKEAIAELFSGTSGFLSTNKWLRGYFRFCIQYSAPFLIFLVFLHSLGLFF